MHHFPSGQRGAGSAPRGHHGLAARPRTPAPRACTILPVAVPYVVIPTLGAPQPPTLVEPRPPPLKAAGGTPYPPANAGASAPGCGAVLRGEEKGGAAASSPRRHRATTTHRGPRERQRPPEHRHLGVVADACLRSKFSRDYGRRSAAIMGPSGSGSIRPERRFGVAGDGGWFRSCAGWTPGRVSPPSHMQRARPDDHGSRARPTIWR